MANLRLRRVLNAAAIVTITGLLYYIFWTQPKRDAGQFLQRSSMVDPSQDDVLSNQRCLKIDTERKQRIIIIGAGPTGLGVVHRLYELGVQRSNTQVIILEQESEPGGLASSYRDKYGFLWDNGGHVIFSHYPHYDHAINTAVPEWNKRSRAAYGFMMGSSGRRRFLPYPVQNSIHLMDEVEQDKSLQGLLKITRLPDRKKPTNFDEWLLKYFGEGLCEVFMRKYNRKVWTVDPTEMNSLWMGERVAVPDVEEIKTKIATAKEKQAEDTKWGPNQFFRYPQYGGTGAIWKSVANLLPQGWFHYNQKLIGVDSEKKIIRVQDSQSSSAPYSLHYDYLISTAPLDIFSKMINSTDKTFTKVRNISDNFVYSHTHVVGIGLSGQPPDFLANKSWIYFPDSDSPFYRVTVLSNYADDMVPQPPGKYWSLMCEAAEPKLNNDPAYWSEDSMIKETINALVNYGFIDSKDVVSKYHRQLDHGYPVPFLKREELLSAVQPWLEARDIYSRGRFGGWRYEVGNQDHSFMQGVELADRIMLGIPEETYPTPNLVNSMQSSDRTLSCKPISVGPKYEFVVSHFHEDLSWLGKYADHCHVYDKSEQPSPMNLTFQQWEHLPNVGRESHTYLHHIISSYDHLADITVFLQGSYTGHSWEVYSDPLEYVIAANSNGLSFHHYTRLTDWGRVTHVGKWKEELEQGTMRPAKESLGQFWESIFGTPHPVSTAKASCGLFGVSKKRIKAHPKEFYEKIISYVSDHSNPEEGHYVERLWPAIFGKFNILSLS